MNSGACSTMRAPDAARRGSDAPRKARGTLSDLAAGCTSLPAASAGRGSPSTAPSGVTIPARALEVAASNKPGGGSLFLVVGAPANPSPEEPQWSAHTRPRSSTRFAISLRKAKALSSFAVRKVCRAAGKCSAGQRVMASLQPAFAKRVSSAITTALRSPSLPRRMPAILRLGAWRSMLSAGILANSAMRSPSGRLWRRL